jgi:CheY-like chemotaxis protein
VNALPVTILLVEDDDIDALTVKRCLKQAKITNEMVRANDGVEALEMLRGTHATARLTAPYLLLVDIRMPRLDGIGLINEIRKDPKLTRTVIFVLTTSDADRDKMAAYNAHVAGYIIKTGSPDQFLTLATMLNYYLVIVEPPPVHTGG